MGAPVPRGPVAHDLRQHAQGRSAEHQHAQPLRRHASHHRRRVQGVPLPAAGAHAVRAVRADRGARQPAVDRLPRMARVHRVRGLHVQRLRAVALSLRARSRSAGADQAAAVHAAADRLEPDGQLQGPEPARTGNGPARARLAARPARDRARDARRAAAGRGRGRARARGEAAIAGPAATARS